MLAGATNSHWLDLRLILQEETHVRYYKPSQGPVLGEVIDPKSAYNYYFAKWK